MWHDLFAYFFLSSFLCFFLFFFHSPLLSFFLGWQRPNIITGLSDVTWLIHTRDIHSHVTWDIRTEIFIRVTTRVAYLFRTCVITHSYGWHDSFMCLTRLIRMSTMTQLYVRRDSSICGESVIRIWKKTYASEGHNSICDTTMCDTTLWVTPDTTPCVPQLYVFHNSLCVPQLCMCATTLCVPQRIRMSATTLCVPQLYVWHHSMYATCGTHRVVSHIELLHSYEYVVVHIELRHT